ncbi:MAG: hypothetical protein HYU88_12455 [Chloroflexi bacterium]|nr:hypothetical protein [Chloroflexota bacterium]
MGRPRAGWLVLMYCQLSTALALWLAVAVPVACHHAAPQPLFLATPHDHGVHAHGAFGPLQPRDGHRLAQRGGLAAEPLPGVGERCASCHLHATSPAADAAALAPPPDVAPPVTVLRLHAPPAGGGPSPVLARDDPPPRAALPSTSA